MGIAEQPRRLYLTPAILLLELLIIACILKFTRSLTYAVIANVFLNNVVLPGR